MGTANTHTQSLTYTTRACTFTRFMLHFATSAWLLLSVLRQPDLMFHFATPGYCCQCTDSFMLHFATSAWLLLSVLRQPDLMFHFATPGYCCQFYLMGYCTRQRKGVCEECCVQKHSDCIRSHVRERDSRLMAEERRTECHESLGALQVVFAASLSSSWHLQ